MPPIILILALLTFATGTHACSAAEIQTLIFPSQKPIDNQPWTVPEAGTYQCTLFVDDMVVKWVEPDAGVTSNTGVLVILHGISVSADCNKTFTTWDETWANSRDLIICNIYYRNANFFPPYDFGLYQMVDVLRGLGWLLDAYPEANLQRLYLFGSSGGGHVALQLAAVYPELWAEIYSHSPITKITMPNDRLNHNYERDPSPYGWDVNFMPSYRQTNLTVQQLRQLQAERLIRSPQWNLSHAESVTLISTPIYVFHGTADDITDHQHLLDLQNVIAARFDSPGQSITANYAEGVTIANWTFWSILNGTHAYAGAHPSLNNRAVATNTLCPNAFLSSNPNIPSLIVNGQLPRTDIWQYRLTGPLKTCKINLETTSNIEDWKAME